MWKIAATGHRPNKLYGYNLYDIQWIRLAQKMKNFLLDRLQTYSELECITGMALGVDQLFGLVALKLRNEGKKIKIFAALPCRGQEKMWKSKEHWEKLMENVDEIYYVHDGEYTNRCMQERNIFMVNRADEILAVWDGTPGGTANCIKYAELKKKPIINIFEN